MGNQDGKLKRTPADLRDRGESRPEDGENVKKGGRKSHGKCSESHAKKRSKSESRTSVFSNLRIRKTLSRSKDGTCGSNDDVLGGQHLQTDELDSAHSVATKTPEISMSADEGGLSDTDADHSHVNKSLVAAAGHEIQEGQKTSSGSDTDLYSFHSATEQDDLLLDIQMAIKMQFSQEGSQEGETDHLSKVLQGPLSSSHTIFWDAGDQLASNKEIILSQLQSYEKEDIASVNAAQLQRKVGINEENDQASNKISGNNGSSSQVCETEECRDASDTGDERNISDNTCLRGREEGECLPFTTPGEELPGAVPATLESSPASWKSSETAQTRTETRGHTSWNGSSRGQFFAEDWPGFRNFTGPGLKGDTSRSADWTNDLIKAQKKSRRKGSIVEESGVPRKSSSVPASSSSLSNVLRGQTLLEKLFSQQRNAAEDAEKLCSEIVSMSLLLPFSDCFREQCTKSTEQISSNIHQSQFLTWAAVSQPTHSMNSLEECFPQRVQVQRSPSSISLDEKHVNFLDLRITLQEGKVTTDVYRKPTATNSLLRNRTMDFTLKIITPFNNQWINITRILHRNWNILTNDNRQPAIYPRNLS